MVQRKWLSRVVELVLGVGLVAVVALGLLTWSPVRAAPSQAPGALAACAEAAFSTEQHFLSHGPDQPDGNPVISDGDLLSPRGVVCLRNRELLAAFMPPGVPRLPDLGLDSADILQLDPPLVAFSTEIDDPLGRFTEGDLLTTSGVIIPNGALLRPFGVNYDVGLDEAKFIGQTRDILAFLEFAKGQTPQSWQQVSLPEVLRRYKVDIWFSTEQTVQQSEKGRLLDGDILSARDVAVVLSQDSLLAAPIPGGIPTRGVDFGLDAFAVRCDGERDTVRFSTEIVYRDDPTLAFSDGDLLKLGGAVLMRNKDFVQAFEPQANHMGLDAVTFFPDRRSCGEENGPTFLNFLPMILKQFTIRGGR
ncbi:MAG: hypothetical protein KIT87_27375 [Anaerolineae bacterium]|nr:hypothetical protein [Anaerolineae bacterium]